MKWLFVKQHFQSSLPPLFQLRSISCPSQCVPRKQRCHCRTSGFFVRRMSLEPIVDMHVAWRTIALCVRRGSQAHPRPPVSVRLKCLYSYAAFVQLFYIQFVLFFLDVCIVLFSHITEQYKRDQNYYWGSGDRTTHFQSQNQWFVPWSHYISIRSWTPNPPYSTPQNR